MQALCKAWVIAISLQGGVPSGIQEGVFALFLHRGCKETGKRGRRTSLPDTQEELPSQRKHEERLGFGFFPPSLRVNLLKVWVFFSPEWKIEQLGRLVSLPPSRQKKKWDVGDESTFWSLNYKGPCARFFLSQLLNVGI